ncbi:MAG: zinc ABC transporter substrate-binding protein [Actinobacteria bacterium]|nr:zinc ABC transporter substrate-binding protein [Actinomycetota bacterium]
MAHRMTPPSRLLASVGLAAALAFGATACGDTSSDGPNGAADITIVTGFYPAQFLADSLLGDSGTNVDVVNLTPPGAEPHHLELTPDDVIRLAEADLVITLDGFQHAVDEAIEEARPAAVIDLAPAADLTTKAGSDGLDYHFWLDTTRYGRVASTLAERLTELIPAEADAIAANLATLLTTLDAVDTAYRDGLAACEQELIVTGHTAFGYLAQRYGLVERGIAGLEPEDEPSANALADLATLVNDNGVTTIFFETLTSPDIAKTLAAETGANTNVLDPIEGVSNDSRGGDYVAIMNSNLEALRAGLRCG